MAENDDLDCDVCGQYLDPEHRYAVTVVHGNLQEEFDFCSRSCLSRWTKQYTEEQRREAAQKLEHALSADGESGEEPNQDLEEEIAEHFEEQPAPSPQAYGTPASAPEGEAEGYGGDAAYPNVAAADILGELEQSEKAGGLTVYGKELTPKELTPITRQLEEMDPAEKGKREKEEQEEKERKQMQEELERSEEH